MNNVASTTILVTANPDLDDCLTGAAEAYIAEFPELEGYDLSPRWEVDSDRRYVELTVPLWHAQKTDQERADESEVAS